MYTCTVQLGRPNVKQLTLIYGRQEPHNVYDEEGNPVHCTVHGCQCLSPPLHATTMDSYHTDPPPLSQRRSPHGSQLQLTCILSSLVWAHSGAKVCTPWEEHFFSVHSWIWNLLNCTLLSRDLWLGIFCERNLFKCTLLGRNIFICMQSSLVRNLFYCMYIVG